MKETRLPEEVSGAEWQASALFADPDMRVADALRLLHGSPGAAVPVVSSETGEIVGVLSRPGLTMMDLPEPMPVPRLGGMATPLGVYLTDGVVGGGAGFAGLFLTGLLLGAWSLVAQGIAGGLTRALTPSLTLARLGLAAASPAGAAWLGQMTAWLLAPLLSALLVFAALRGSPLAGTHAAEHQVVHCLERRQPLVAECVRAMPRVHPRCGTNLVAGFAIFHAVFLAAFAWAQEQNYGTFDAVTLGLLAAAPLTVLLWRRVGGWLQQHLATRPATPAQIDSAIRAAQQVLSRRAAGSGTGRVRFPLARRVWAMGLPSVMLGYAAALGAAEALAFAWPQAGAFLGL